MIQNGSKGFDRLCPFEAQLSKPAIAQFPYETGLYDGRNLELAHPIDHVRSDHRTVFNAVARILLRARASRVDALVFARVVTES